MVFIWGSGFGGRRRGPGPGWGRRGWGPPPGYGGYGPPPGYGYRRGGGGGGCLRDLFLLETGCCLAEALGCGFDTLLVAPSTVRAVRRAGTGEKGRLAARMVAAVRVYQREVSPHRRPCCTFSPTCSSYAVQALERHGAARGTWLTARRLLRCRPGAVGGSDPVPAAA